MPANFLAWTLLFTYMNTTLEDFRMSRSFNSSVELEFASSTMELPYEAAENYPEMDSMYANSMAVQYCQPYLDHSYASQLPTASAAPDIASLSVPETLASFIDIEDVSCHTTVVTAPMGGGKSVDDSSSDPWEGSVTRCICDFQHDDGYMICCDRCGVWQHVDCMGVDRNNIPDSYLCELCSPRLVDKRRAIRLQTLKKDKLDVEASATDSSAEERYGSGKRGGRRPGIGRKRRDSQSTVPQSKRVRRRTTSEPVDDKSAELRKNAQANMQNHKPVTTKRTRRSTMDSQRNVTIDHSREDFCRNTYSSGVLLLLATLKQTDAASGSLSTNNPSLLKDQISKQRYHTAQCEPGCKGIETTEAIRAGQAVAEYTGHVMLLEENQPDNKQLNMSAPFLLHYEGTESFRFSFCIDSSSVGNDIRFIRCSCTPNAKVLHVVEQNAIRFFICATKSIGEGREVTVPFSYDYTKSSSEVKCACARAACPVARFFRSKSTSRPVRTGRGRKSSISEEERNKTDALPAAAVAAASLAAGGSDRVAVPSGVKQRRRSSLRSELQQDQPISQDVSADVHLINKLTAAVDQPVLSVALTSNYASEPCTVSSETSWKNHESLTTDSQLNHPPLSVDHDDAEAGSLVIALGDDATPSRKTREQKKIEAVEKTFEKIEKVNVRGKETNQRAKANKTKTQNEKINNEEKRKKTPNSKNKPLPSNETSFPAASNGGGRTSMRAKKPRGKPQAV